MAKKSKFVSALDEIQTNVYESVKDLGFRKRGRTLNREANEKGIFEVINFQAGPYELAPEIPPFRINLYGKFTVNLGVLIKELYDFVDYHKPTNFYQEHYCHARQRLPVLLYGKDIWWDLTDDTNTKAEIVSDGLRTAGLGFFKLYDTRLKFKENFGRFNDAPPRARLDVALMVLHSDRVEGERLFREYYSKSDITLPHRSYLRELARELNIDLID